MAQGDDRALDALYRQHAATMLGLALRLLHDREEALDVVQDVFSTAWRNAHRYDRSRASVVTWLAVMTRSRSIDRLRSRKIRDRVDAELTRNICEHQSETSSRRLLQRQRGRRLRSALDGLPETQRQVLEMAYFEGLTQSEIAERVGAPLGTVKTRTLLAFRKLRLELAAELQALI
jgi:RNA polymerase sigma-70 factor (ECF subfamily)